MIATGKPFIWAISKNKLWVCCASEIPPESKNKIGNEAAPQPSRGLSSINLIALPQISILGF